MRRAVSGLTYISSYDANGSCGGRRAPRRRATKKTGARPAAPMPPRTAPRPRSRRASEEGRERGRGEGGEEERDGDEYHQLDVDERDRGPDVQDERPPAAAHVEERERDARAHHCDVDGQRQAEAEIFSQKELAATDGLGEDCVDRSALDLLVDEADADEDGDEDAEQEHGGEPHVHDDLLLLRRRKLA